MIHIDIHIMSRQQTDLNEINHFKEKIFSTVTFHSLFRQRKFYVFI